MKKNIAFVILSLILGIMIAVNTYILGSYAIRSAIWTIEEYNNYGYIVKDAIHHIGVSVFCFITTVLTFIFGIISVCKNKKGSFQAVATTVTYTYAEFKEHRAERREARKQKKFAKMKEKAAKQQEKISEMETPE